MTAKVVRLCDYDKRSKQPDAAQPRDPCEADVIVLPVVRVERFIDQPNIVAATMRD